MKKSPLDGVPYDADNIFDDEKAEEDLVPSAPIVVSEPAIPATVALRNHQKAAIGGSGRWPGILPSFKQGKRSGLVRMATGTGKSVVIADLARRADGWGHTTLLLSHRKHLMEQLDGSLARVGLYALHEQAENDAFGMFGPDFKTVIASVQTLQGDRLLRWPKDSFRLIMSDEAHHAVGDGWMSILNHFGALPGQRGARHVGFTATADRLDGKNLGRVFEDQFFEYNLKEGIRDGWLVPLETVVLKGLDPPINLRNLKVSNGTDFSNEALDEIIFGEIGRIVNALVDDNTLRGLPTICFAPDVASAEAVAYALQDVGISAQSISYKSKNQKEILGRFREREFQVLVNAMLLSEGIDIPFLVNCLILRATKSRALFSQMVGRITRPYPGKEKGRIIDLPYLTNQLDLVGMVDLFDDISTDDRLIAIAKKISERKAREKDSVSLEEVMEEAEEEFNMTQRVRIQRRPVHGVKSFSFDPIGVMDLLGMPQKQFLSDWSAVNPATDKQKQFLTKLGVNNVDNLGKAEAGRLLSKLMPRLTKGLATLKQVNYLVHLGVEPAEARDLSRGDAGKLITQLKGT